LGEPVEVLWFVLEMLADLFLEVVLEVGFSGFKRALGRENHSALVATLGYLSLGAALGALSVAVLPHRIFEPGLFRGVSLVLSPVAGAIVMDWWGGLRQDRGYATTNLATWYGGGGFALGLALLRFMLVR
jgi:hypothetical protein